MAKVSVVIKKISENKIQLHVNGFFVEMDAETEEEVLRVLSNRSRRDRPIPAVHIERTIPKEQWEAMDQAVRYIEKDYNERLCRLEDWRFDLTNQLKATTQNRKRLEYIEEALDAFATMWVSETKEEDEQEEEEESKLYIPDQSKELILPQLNQRLTYQKKAGRHYLYVPNGDQTLWPLESVREVEDKLDEDVAYRVWRKTANILHLIPDPPEDHTESSVIKVKVGKPFVYKS